MSNIRRHYEEGRVYFLTHVTYRRIPILVEHGELLLEAMAKARAASDIQVLAWSVLPDHCHMLVDPGAEDLSLVMRRMKLSFSSRYRQRTAAEAGRVWQYRFWDHIIRDPDDLNRHLDYIHYNPVKHGLIDNPFDWELSTAKRYLDAGHYQADWGVANSLEFNGSFGE